MGRRSNFPRRPHDNYETPRPPVEVLLPHLGGIKFFAEPCAGRGVLKNHLEAFGLTCVYAADVREDIEDPVGAGIRLGVDAMAVEPAIYRASGAEAIITNPPWTRQLMHPLIDNFMRALPTWLLFDADWIHNQQAAPFLKHCVSIVSVGRIKWMPGSDSTGKDNAAWHCFDVRHVDGPRFIGRDGKEKSAKGNGAAMGDVVVATPPPRAPRSKSLIVIPQRGEPVTAQQLVAIEQSVAAKLLDVDDFDLLEEWRANARALEGYLRDKDLQQPMLGTQRRCEARIGMLLGEPKEGRPWPEITAGTTAVNPADQIERHDRADFRILAHALDDCPLDPDEWRKSRRALVSLIRNRLGLLPPLPVLPDGVFRCIVADPPWQVDTGPDAWNTTGESGHDTLAYEQMTIEQIMQMDVASRASEEGAHLYLWTINKYVEQSYAVARAWGFKPSVLLVWAKTPHGVGLGDAYKLTTEFILYARRGTLKESRACETTWFNWPRGIHSRKPEEFFKLVESMTPAPHAERDRLELFAREQRAGWTTWGDEVP